MDFRFDFDFLALISIFRFSHYSRWCDVHPFVRSYEHLFGLCLFCPTSQNSKKGIPIERKRNNVVTVSKFCNNRSEECKPYTIAYNVVVGVVCHTVAKQFESIPSWKLATWDGFDLFAKRLCTSVQTLSPLLCCTVSQNNIIVSVAIVCWDN